jgi:scyllo-inositol 2-dehydrogenase (NADP+)
MTDAIGVGLVGFGMASRVFHVPIIRSVPELSLKAIVSSQTADIGRLVPEAKAYADIDSLLSDPTIELVVIATPTNTHFDLARQSLDAGQHVIVEKPFTTTCAQANELIDLANRHGKILTVFQNRRWDGDFLTVKRLLAEGMLGRLVEYESHFDRFRNQPRLNWRETEVAGGGILFDLGSHLIDQSLVLFGLPLMIAADVRTQRDFGKSDDNFELILDYDRLKVTLKSGMLVREQSPHFILHGTTGSFVKYGLDPQEEALKRGLTPTDSNWGEEPAEQWGRLLAQFGELNFDGRVETIAGCYPAYYRNVVDAIRGRAELVVKPEQAKNVIRIIELAIESNQRRCAIPFSPM